MDASEIEDLLSEINSFQASSASAVEEFRVRFLGKKGILRGFFSKLKDVDASSKKEFGLLINKVKESAEQKIATFSGSKSDEGGALEGQDLTLP
ncbi:MAG: phenylalanine--tRNA ligase subunit alpha, partial [Bacteroidetes bacterium]